jgi:hypothetical protein
MMFASGKDSVMRALSVFASALFIGAIAACTGTSDDLSASEAAVVDDPKNIAADRLAGAWTAETGSKMQALVFRVELFGGTDRFLSVGRDLEHKPTKAEDKAQSDRNSLQWKMVSAESPEKGVLELAELFFEDEVTRKLTETYAYELANGGATLTLTETKEVEEIEDKKTEKPVRPPMTLTRVDSWCTAAQLDPRDTETSNPVDDCQSQFGKSWKPTDGPPECKGREANCMRCEEHRCKLVKVSSCELVGNFCFESLDACQFQNGSPAGQATTIDEDGNAISCEGRQRAGKPICCKNFFAGRRGGEGGDL